MTYNKLTFIKARINLRIRFPWLVLLKFDDKGINGKNSIFLDLDHGIFIGTFRYVFIGDKQHPSRTKLNRLRAYSHKDVLNKRNKTNQDRYGYTNYFEQVDKIKQHCLDKYGVDNPLKNKEIFEKVKNTNISRYGIYNPSKNPEIIKKIKNNFEKKYGLGITAAMHIPDNIDKIINSKRQKGLLIIIEGKLLSEIAKEKKLSFNRAYTIYKNFGPEALISYKSNSETQIEFFIKILLKKHNICFTSRAKFQQYNLYPDICIGSDKLIIECDGEFWHCDRVHQGKVLEKKGDRLNRRRFFEEKGFSTLFFRGSEIIYYQKTIEAIILNKLKILPKQNFPGGNIKIFDKYKDFQKMRNFFSKNHLIPYKTLWDYDIGIEDPIQGIIALSQCSIDKNRKIITIRNFAIKNEFKNLQMLGYLCLQIKKKYVVYKNIKKLD